MDGEFLPTASWPRLARFQEHTIELPVADMHGATRTTKRELRDALARALEFGKGVVHVIAPLDGLMQGKAEVSRAMFSTKRACPSCGTQLPRARPAAVLLQLQARLVRELFRHRA